MKQRIISALLWAAIVAAQNVNDERNAALAERLEDAKRRAAQAPATLAGPFREHIAVLEKAIQPAAGAPEWSAAHRSGTALSELAERSGAFSLAAAVSKTDAELYYYFDNNEPASMAPRRRAVELARRAGPSAELAEYQADLARALNAESRYEDASAAALESFTYSIVHAPTQAGDSLRQFARAEFSLRRGGGVRQRAEAALKLAEEKQLRDLRYLSLIALGLDAAGEGRHEEAFGFFERAFAIEEKGSAMGSAVATEALRVVLTASFRMEAAEALRVGRAAQNSLKGVRLPFEALARRMASTRRTLAGEFDSLLLEERQVVEEGRRENDRAKQGMAISRMAGVFRSAGAWREAAQLYEQAAALLENTDAGMAADVFRLTALEDIAQAHLESGEVSRARAAARTLLRILRAKPPAERELQRIKVVRTELVLAQAEAKLGDPEAAQAALERAKQQREGLTDPFLETTALTIARLETDPQRAIAGLTAARDSARRGGRRTTELDAGAQLARRRAENPAAPRGALLDELAALDRLAQELSARDRLWSLAFIRGLDSELRGEADAAVRQYRLAAGGIERARAAYPTAELRTAFLARPEVAEVFERLVALLQRLGRTEQAWRELERIKGRTIRELRLAAAKRALPKENPLARIEQRLRSVQFMLQPANEAAVRSAGENPDRLREELRELETQFVLEESRVETLMRAGEVDLRAVRAALQADTAILEYSVAPERSLAFVITQRDAVRGLAVETGEEPLRRLVRRYRALLADPASERAELDETARELAAAVLWPALRALPAGTRRLIVVPSSSLFYVPFSALPLEAGGQPVMDRYEVTMLPSAAAITDGGPSRQGGNLFIGALGRLAVDGMPPLPATLDEARAINELFPGARRFTESEFTRGRAREALSGDAIVHLATHGLFEERTPLFSSLVTAPTAGEPSRLPLYEIARGRVAARLVVLSACQTGVGKLWRGDEVTGLTQAFLGAGARAVVSSYWEVSDEATAKLMSALYRGVSRGVSAAAALRSATQEVRRAHPHPFYWAAFAITGNP